jgi:hypothetical protein
LSLVEAFVRQVSVRVVTGLAAGRTGVVNDRGRRAAEAVGRTAGQ